MKMEREESRRRRRSENTKPTWFLRPPDTRLGVRSEEYYVSGFTPQNKKKKRKKPGNCYQTTRFQLTCQHVFTAVKQEKAAEEEVCVCLCMCGEKGFR